MLGGAHTLGHLLLTGGVTEVGGGSADIVDIALEIRLPHHLLRLRQNGLVAAGLDNTPLVEGKGTEAAPSKAAPAGNQAEAHLFNGRHAPRRLIRGVVCTHIGQPVHPIHLRLTQGLLGWILNDIFFGTIGLHQRFPGVWVGVAVLGVKALGILSFVLAQFLVGRQGKVWHHQIHLCGPVHRAIYERDVLGLEPAVQGVCHLHHGAFPHAIHQEIRLAVQQNGPLELVRPIIVMGHAPQAGLNAADENGNVLIHPSDQVAVNHRSIIGPFSYYSAWCKGI